MAALVDTQLEEQKLTEIQTEERQSPVHGVQNA
jgi:hypothetical protein